jgi:hypothetical protein
MIASHTVGSPARDHQVHRAAARSRQRTRPLTAQPLAQAAVDS